MEDLHLGDDRRNPTRFISTAIPFINGPPHLGHALELVQADALARYWRARGRDVRFQTGTDENSLKTIRAAEAWGLTPEVFAARASARFRALRGVLDLDWDTFVRTSADASHRSGALRLWKALRARGDLYRERYAGHYCVGCERFVPEAEQTRGRCPEHDAPLEWIEEANWFFRLSRYTDRLAELLRTGRLQVIPESRRNEALAWIDAGLPDLSVSRSATRACGWGIPVPDDPDQVIYVWIDALGSYISGLGFAEDHSDFARYWDTAECREHVIGKGITRFHALYWPALLMSAGLPLPDRLLVHGYVTASGAKIAKSGGNAIDPVALAAKHGSDALRFYLLRHLRTTEDGDFDPARLEVAYERELAGALGNLLHRSLALLARRGDGAIPEGSAPRDLRDAADALETEIARTIERFALHDALAAIWRFVALLNRHVDRTRPWDLAKSTDVEASRALDDVLYTLAEGLRIVSVQLAPFLPNAAQRIARALGTPTEDTDVRFGTRGIGARTRGSPPLFPRRDTATRT